MTGSTTVNLLLSKKLLESSESTLQEFYSYGIRRCLVKEFGAYQSISDSAMVSAPTSDSANGSRKLYPVARAQPYFCHHFHTRTYLQCITTVRPSCSCCTTASTNAADAPISLGAAISTVRDLHKRVGRKPAPKRPLTYNGKVKVLHASSRHSLTIIADF